MSTRISKVLLLVEALVLVLPICALFLTLLPGALLFFRSVPAFAASILVATIGVALVATVAVMGRFWTQGAQGLRVLPKSWWGLCSVGAVISVLGGLYVLLKNSVHLPSNEFLVALKLSSFGLPLLLPYAHLLLEYFFRKETPHAA